ncbi:hypothetical protein KSC_110540 [Ktedonobacter sp. SOSP1-52]|nr:hypothetical protein KSC_110540 [Ktedonobacter sp. SOSP1-52]
MISPGSPAEIALQFACLLKVGNIPDGGDDSCRLYHSDRRHGKQDLPFSTIPHDICNLCIQAFHMFLDQP